MPQADTNTIKHTIHAPPSIITICPSTGSLTGFKTYKEGMWSIGMSNV
jgi:hypothetical protein